MAHLAAHFSSLLLIILLISPHIQARNGKFLPDVESFSSPSLSPAPGPVVSEISHAPATFGNGFAPGPVLSSPGPAPGISDLSNEEALLESGFPGEPVSSSPSPAPGNSEISDSPGPGIRESSQAPGPGIREISQAPGLGIREISDAPAPAESDNAYGLYGSEFNDQFPAKKTTTTNVENEDNNPTEEFNTDSFRESNTIDTYNNYGNKMISTTNNNENGYLPSNYNNNNENGYLPSNYNNNNEAYMDNYNGNGFVNRQGMSDTRFLDNRKSYYNTHGMSDTRFLDNGKYYHNTHGMSDTRFLDNGKYYYDTRKEYESGTRSGSSGGYYSEKSNYEFDSMDEYEKQQGYPYTQREYIP